MKVKKIEGMEEVIDKILDDLADRILDKAVEILNTPDAGGRVTTDRGTLAQSGDVDRQFLKKTIVFDAAHAASIEFGRRPGQMPPVDAIKRWVQRRGLAKSEKDATSLAWAIAKSIELHGFDARPFLQPAVDITLLSRGKLR